MCEQGQQHVWSLRSSEQPLTSHLHSSQQLVEWPCCMQAVGAWSVEACSANECNRDSGYCIDHSASANFLFGLWPGPPARFLPTGTSTGFQTVASSYWPVWGNGSSYSNDLDIGGTGPIGAEGYCHQGGTYGGSPSEICGGPQKWGKTDLEVWRPS